MDALGQHRRQKAPDQLLGREGQGFPPMELGVLITKTDLTIVDREHPVVRHRDAVNVPAHVAAHLFRALHGRFAIDDPRGGPDGLGNVQIGALLRHEGSEEPSAELGARLHRHEVGLAGRLPLSPVTGDPTGRDQAVAVRMVDQRPGPGVQDAEDTKPPPHIMRVRGQLDERLRRGPEPDVVEVLLVAADERSQLLGHGQDDMQVGHR